MAAIYDSFAKFYDMAFAPLERAGLAKWRRETLAMLPENASILEIGCGTGANFEYYPRCDRAVSSELSIRMLETARAKRRENHLIQADAQSLPFAENDFDAAFATLVFCSIPDPARALQEVKRVLKPGGLLVLLEHVRPDGLAGRLFDGLNFFTVLLAEDHFNRRTADMVASEGFEIVEIRKKMGGIVNLIIAGA